MACCFFRGYHTETAGTAILEVIQVQPNLVPRINTIVYEAGVTEHTLTIMKPNGFTFVSKPAAASGNTIQVESIDPGKTTANVDENLAANDYVIWVDEHQQYHADFLSSVSGDTLTIDGTLPNDIKKGQQLWTCYEVGRATHTQLKLPASSRVTLSGYMQGGFSRQEGVQTASGGHGWPLLVHIDNITNAGKLHYLSGDYVSETLV